MLLQWRTDYQSWRWRTGIASQSKYVCLFLAAFLMTKVTAIGNSFPPSQMPVVQQFQNNPAAAQHILTGPSVLPNYHYQIENQNKLAQRQLQPGGITAAATNYLLQQLEVERHQQQQRQFQQPIPVSRSGPVQPPHNLHSNNQQAQTMQLLAGLTPQQIAALQSVMPRSNQQPQQPHSPSHVSTSGSSTAPVAVLPPEDMQIQFSQRVGPFDKLLSKAKAWLPDMVGAGSMNARNSAVGEPKMRDLHRLPKPPKYPLYDLPSIGQATPPPAPIMHPMASLPNSAFDWETPPASPINSSPRPTYNQQNWMSPSPTSSTSRRSRPSPRPPKPSKSSFLRNPLGRGKKPRPSAEPPANYNRRNHGPPPPQRQPPRGRNRNPPPKPPKNGGSPPRGRFPPPPRNNRPQSAGPTGDPYTSSGPMGFEHPMASNLSPAQSPALGRPLDYDEYMARPSHSYTDDPWNFDPFASQMNQGLNTHALSYNYDPLGMNALDTEANSHLDPNKLSYPGDSFNQDMVKDSPGIGSTAQVGGWDKPYKKRPYNSDPDTELTPPGSGSPYSSSSSFSSSPSDPYSPPSSSGSRYKSRDRENSSGSSSGSRHTSDTLNGGRRGDFPMDPHDSESSLSSYGGSNRGRNQERQRYETRNGPRYEPQNVQRYESQNEQRYESKNGQRYESKNGQRYEPQNDEAPTIDLETLSPQQEDDGMSGLEFTIETSMDKGAQLHSESPQPDPHPLGPMQPASNPYLSDQYNPYVDESSPSESTIPGSPYGPNGFRERYGRRKTRNNPNGSSASSFQSRSSSSAYRSSRARAHQQQRAVAQQSAVPEGVQIFNDIIRPQLQSSSTSRHHHHQQRVAVHPNHAALRRSLYKAIRQSSRK